MSDEWEQIAQRVTSVAVRLQRYEGRDEWDLEALDLASDGLGFLRERLALYEAGIDRLRVEVEWLRAENDAWMNGVADAVEPFGFDREAACGPADLLPGLRILAERAVSGSPTSSENDR